MDLTILAATGATGRELTRQALDRGHTVTALARHPDKLDPLRSPRLRVAVADVREPGSVTSAVHADSVVLSGLGVAKGDTGTLTAVPGRWSTPLRHGSSGSARTAPARPPRPPAC